MVKVSKTSNELVRYLDVVVDGKFEEDKKDLKLRFRGSSNQRIIDVVSSLKEKKAVLVEKYNVSSKTSNRERASGVYI